MDVRELRNRKRPRLAAHPILLDPRLLDDYQTIEARLAGARAVEEVRRKRGSASMDEPDETTDLEERLQAKAAEIDASTATLHLRALPAGEWTELVNDDEYKPTESDLEAGMDVNWRAITPVLLAVSCYAVTEGTEQPDDDAWREVDSFELDDAAAFFIDLSQGEQEQLFLSLRNLNQGHRTVPTNRRGSAVTGRSAPTSNTQ